MVEVYEVLASDEEQKFYAYPPGTSFPIKGEVLGLFTAHLIAPQYIHNGGKALEAALAAKIQAKKDEWGLERLMPKEEVNRIDGVVERMARERLPNDRENTWSPQVEAETVAKPSLEVYKCALSTEIGNWYYKTAEGEVDNKKPLKIGKYTLRQEGITFKINGKLWGNVPIEQLEEIMTLADLKLPKAKK